MRLNTFKFKPSRVLQAGLTLVETNIVVAITIAIAVTSLSVISNFKTDQKTIDTGRLLLSIRDQVQNVTLNGNSGAGNAMNFDPNLPTTLPNNPLIPSQFKTPAGTLVDGNKNPVNLSLVTYSIPAYPSVTNNLFAITVQNLSDTECVTLAMRSATSFFRVLANNTLIGLGATPTSAGRPQIPSVADATNSCNLGTGNNVLTIEVLDQPDLVSLAGNPINGPVINPTLLATYRNILSQEISQRNAEVLAAY